MQKFFRGQLVRICDEMPSCMRHFQCGCDAIIQYSYSDVYGTDDDINYSLLLMEPEPHEVSWYVESQLTLISDDRVKGEEMLQKHKNDRRNNE